MWLCTFIIFLTLRYKQFPCPKYILMYPLPVYAHKTYIPSTWLVNFFTYFFHNNFPFPQNQTFFLKKVAAAWWGMNNLKDNENRRLQNDGKSYCFCWGCTVTKLLYFVDRTHLNLLLFTQNTSTLTSISAQQSTKQSSPIKKRTQ